MCLILEIYEEISVNFALLFQLISSPTENFKNQTK